ncbi:porin [Marivirga tractuosa]|uniref:Phosphate-selective porin O and P n=1 Tax=Marivirga tractuosa (strain ATCC 23168 / DSM 4126 / NBRC 15989 / NCIMB 1408 / VKM B-1430 / H-43) TaxID=643867 RepID=E4TUJ5_MARTH|nr:porin [Marivirga tractuosa]ADR23088.1 phosphate-selective porin O and P [Marivirga tractuosa DSM 4126]BDD16238.1 porin [Marivirga tractuosa]
MQKISLTFLIFFLIIQSSQGQIEKMPYDINGNTWFENIKIGGYVQSRYNRLLETNPNLDCSQCDKSWGAGNGISLRRVRLKFSGNLGDYVYFYIQPDFASSGSGSGQHYGQLRDAYFDVSLDKAREFRFRFGQSKIPYGFENMQSSQNRLPLDRNDGINSSIKNERELSLLFYWAPQETRKLFRELVAEGLKGSGDYGVVGFGVFNGQTGNSPELNDALHIVGRISYPMQIGNQIIEPGIQAYTGQYQMPRSNLSDGVNVKENLNYLDQRAAATFVLYPQPFGIQAEYNWGTGPEFNKYTNTIEQTSLEGGYATLTYKISKFKQLFYPFMRYHYYDGGKKFELDARSYNVNELEIGMEWRPVRAFELVAHYTISSRRYEDFQNQDNLQTGRLLRLQAQVNF